MGHNDQATGVCDFCPFWCHMLVCSVNCDLGLQYCVGYLPTNDILFSSDVMNLQVTVYTEISLFWK
jgi:hypothetical protein